MPLSSNSSPGRPKDLQDNEKEFIKKNAGTLSPAEIARSLHRKTEIVLNYMRDESLIISNKSGQKSNNQIERELKKKPFYADLMRQLFPEELDFFNEHWIGMMSQFNGDLMPSEELELKELLIIEILKNRESAAEKERLEEKSRLEKEIRQERSLKQPDREKIRDLQQTLTQYSSASSTYVRNFKDLCEKADKMRKALHASRQDRVKNYENSKVDFVSWLKLIEDNDQKLKASREMEIMKQAQIKERQRLYDNHEYANKEIAPPILNEDSVDAETN